VEVVVLQEQVEAARACRKLQKIVASTYKTYSSLYLASANTEGHNTKQPTHMSEININAVNARLDDLQKEIDVIKAEKANLENPTIKGLGIKFDQLDLSKASAVIHLHNALIERLEELTVKVQALEAKAK
jgi:hypothetical protein